MTVKKLRIRTLVRNCREWETFRADFLMSDRKEMVAYCDTWLARLGAEIASLEAQSKKHSIWSSVRTH
jgi:hypothetical protein